MLGEAARQTGLCRFLMLTGLGDPADRIAGLEIGADDYLPKTFSTRELLARLRAVIRRRVESQGRAHRGAGGNYCWPLARAPEITCRIASGANRSFSRPSSLICSPVSPARKAASRPANNSSIPSATGASKPSTAPLTSIFPRCARKLGDDPKERASSRPSAPPVTCSSTPTAMSDA